MENGWERYAAVAEEAQSIIMIVTFAQNVGQSWAERSNVCKLEYATFAEKGLVDFILL